MNVLLVQVIGSIPELRSYSITMNNDVALTMFLHATRRFHAVRDQRIFEFDGSSKF